MARAVDDQLMRMKLGWSAWVLLGCMACGPKLQEHPVTPTVRPTPTDAEYEDFSVALEFPDGHGGRERWPTELELHGDSGGLLLAGLPGACERPELRWTGERASLLLDLRPCASDGHAGRTVQFDGAAAGLDARGRIILELAPVPYLHRDEFEQLLGDSSLAFEFTVVDLELDGGERWVWNRDDWEIVDHQGVEHHHRRGGGSSGFIANGAAIERRTTHRYIDSNVVPTGFEVAPTIMLQVDYWMPIDVTDQRTDSELFELVEQSEFESIEAGRATCTFFDGQRPRVCKFGQVRAQFGSL